MKMKFVCRLGAAKLAAWSLACAAIWFGFGLCGSGFGLGLGFGLGSGLQAQTVNANYEDGGLYIRLKSASAFAVKSGESRLLRAERFEFLREEAANFGIRSEVESMAFANNEVLARTISVTIDDVERIDELIDILRQNPDVELVEKRPVYYVCGASIDGGAGVDGGVASASTGAADASTAADATGGDPLYDASIGGINHKWHLEVIKADEARKLATGKPSIKVAVVDNAIWNSHEDLSIAPENLYNVHTGKVGEAAPPADVNQSPSCTNKNDCPAYLWSHGTHCAGNVGAVSGNGKGMYAVGSGVTLMGVRCAVDAVPGAVSNGFGGLRWAAEHGAKVISLSWGSNSEMSKTESELIKSCYNQGIILVAAAGNSTSSALFYPGASPYVISVGSVDSDKKYSDRFSNYGKWVDILSPGGFIKRGNSASNYSVLSTTFCTNQNYRIDGDANFNGQYYDGMFGTSMATPVAASLVGLLVSVDSTLNTHQVRELLASTAQVVDGNAPRVRDGSGVIDALAAVTALKNSTHSRPTDFVCEVVPPKGMKMSWSAPALKSGEAALSYYRIYKNGVLLKDRVTETSFSDDNLKEGNYTYSVEAVFEDEKTALRDGVDFYMPLYRHINAEVTPKPECGMVQGVGYYVNGDTAVLKAVPAPGYSFVRWKDGDNNLSRDTTIRIGAYYDITLTAVFKENAANEKTGAASAIMVYPNPAEEVLYVENLPSGEGFSGGIYDVAGRLIKEVSLSRAASGFGSARGEIYISELRKGTYILQLISSDGVMRSVKFQKK